MRPTSSCVAAFLRETGAEARLEEFRDDATTARDAARAAGCELAQVVKSLVVDCDGRPVLVLVPGDRKLDLEKVARAARAERARIATAAEVEATTGFTPGGVAPFPLRGIGAVYLDRTLLAHEHVWVGAGSPRHLAVLKPAELARLARAESIDAVVEAPYHPPEGEPAHA